MRLEDDANIAVPFYYQWKYYAGYFQDDFKVLPNLTLNLGVRYDVETPRTEKANRQGWFDPNVTGTLNGSSVRGGFVFAGEDGNRRGLWATNFKGVQPRLGFAWTPFSSMTVRGSYAMLRTPLTGVTNAIVPDLSVPNQSIGGLNGGVNAGIVNIITNPPGPIAAIPPLSDGPLFQGAFSVPYIDQSSVVPYIQQWSLALQFQLTNNNWQADPYGNNTNFRYINPDAFSVPGSLDKPEFGNASRTLPGVRSPWTTFFDANLAKQFVLGEKLRLELRGDFINALNHPNFFINANTGHDLVGAFNRTSLTNPTASPFTVQTAFGKFERNNTTPARLIRVGVRLTF